MKTNKRDSTIRIRVSHQEKKQLIEMLSSQDFDSISSFIRYHIFKKKTPNYSVGVKPRTGRDEMVSDLLGGEVKRIGQNINQVVKKINSTFGSADIKILLEKILFEQKQIERFFEVTNENIKSLR